MKNIDFLSKAYWSLTNTSTFLPPAKLFPFQSSWTHTQDEPQILKAELKPLVRNGREQSAPQHKNIGHSEGK